MRQRCLRRAWLIGLLIAPVIAGPLFLATIWVSLLGGGTLGGYGAAAQSHDQDWASLVISALWLVGIYLDFAIINRVYRWQLRRATTPARR